MDIVVVDGLGKLEFRIHPSVKRGPLIFLTHIQMSPVIERFNIMHALPFNKKRL